VDEPRGERSIAIISVDMSIVMSLNSAIKLCDNRKLPGTRLRQQQLVSCAIPRGVGDHLRLRSGPGLDFQ